MFRPRFAAAVLLVTIVMNAGILIDGASRRQAGLIVANMLSLALLAVMYLRRSGGLSDEDDVTTLDLKPPKP